MTLLESEVHGSSEINQRQCQRGEEIGQAVAEALVPGTALIHRAHEVDCSWFLVLGSWFRGGHAGSGCSGLLAFLLLDDLIHRLGIVLQGLSVHVT